MNRSLAKECFSKEVPHLEGLFSRFESCKGGLTTWEAQFDAEVPYFQISNFTLPENFEPNDQETIIISLANYPDSPPNGIYVHKKSTRNLEKIKSALEGHVYDSTHNTEDNLEALKSNGWKWICFHMENNSWRYNFRNPIKGDCLYSYLLLLFAALNGNYTQ